MENSAILSNRVQLFICSAACRHVCGSAATTQENSSSSHQATASRKLSYFPTGAIQDSGLSQLVEEARKKQVQTDSF